MVTIKSFLPKSFFFQEKQETQGFSLEELPVMTDLIPDDINIQVLTNMSHMN